MSAEYKRRALRGDKPGGFSGIVALVINSSVTNSSKGFLYVHELLDASAASRFLAVAANAALSKVLLPASAPASLRSPTLALQRAPEMLALGT